MKRLNWLKKFGLTAAVGATTVPAILTATSCAVTSCYIDVFDFASMFPHDKESTWTCADIKHYSASFNDLLYGSTKNNGGNYILFVGSNTNDSICKWFCAENIRGRDQWVRDDYFFESAFFKALHRVTDTEDYTHKNLKDFGVYCFIDFYDFNLKDTKGHAITYSKGNDLPEQNVKPFDVWTEATITTTYNYNKHKLSYEWDKESVKKDEYIRNDDFAVAYRAMCKRGLSLFPKTDKRKESFETGNGSDAPRMLIFKDGKLVSINTTIPAADDAGMNGFVKSITDNYKINEEKKQ